MALETTVATAAKYVSRPLCVYSPPISVLQFAATRPWTFTVSVLPALISAGVVQQASGGVDVYMRCRYTCIYESCVLARCVNRGLVLVVASAEGGTVCGVYYGCGKSL
jgi:hypothetical protein